MTLFQQLLLEGQYKRYVAYHWVYAAGSTPGGENRPLKGIEASRRRCSILRIVFRTLSRRSEGSHREAKYVAPIVRVGVAKSFHWPWGCNEQPCQLCNPMLVPPEREHYQNSVLLFPDSPDYLRDQGDRGESIKEEVGPVVGQGIPVLRTSPLGIFARRSVSM